MSTRMIVVAAVAVAAVVVAVAGIVIAAGVFVTSDSSPGKDEPEAYTKALVDEAIARYKDDGRQATIDYYNSSESVDGQWYVFIVDPDGVTIAHHNEKFRGRDPSLRVDAVGYFYGDDLMAATEEGRWVDYVLENPATGTNQQKHTWVVLHDSLRFASGWYEQ